MKVFLTALCLFPLLAAASPTVLLDVVPAEGVFVSYATVNLPIPDVEKENPKDVEAGLASILAQSISFAEQNNASHICILSLAAADAKNFTVAGAPAKIRLQKNNPSFVIVFYRDGHDTPIHPTFSFEKPDTRHPNVSMSFEKVSAPEGWTAASVLYFNLPRIQTEALKTGATTVFLTARGKNPTSAVVVPGAKEPLIVFENKTTISATWYTDGKAR